MKAIVSSFVCLLFVGFTVAQTPSPKPAPEMEKLLKMWTGDWTTVEIFEPSDEMPKGRQDKGSETMRPGPGGLSLIGDYESHGAPFGHMVVTWLPKEKVYKSYWTDSSGPGVAVATGTWQGEKLVFTSIDESSDKKILYRGTYSDITPTSFIDTLESGPVGSPLKRILTVKYAKQAEVASVGHRTAIRIGAAATGPDACANAMTQQDMNQCTAAEYEKANQRLKRIHQKLMDSFNEKEPRNTLQTIEKSWIRYRDLHCEDVRRSYASGSIGPMAWANCMTALTNHRIEEIKNAYESPEFSLE